MTGPARGSLFLPLLAGIALSCGAVGPASAEVYHWVDRDGVVYYTTDPNRIPEEYRDQVRVTRSERPDGDAPAGDKPAAGKSGAQSGSLTYTSGAPIRAEAHLNGVQLTLVLDTGASRTVISSAAFARTGLVVESRRQVRLVGVAGTVEAPEVMIQRLDVAGAQVGPLPVVVYDVPGVTADGLLGRDVLDQFTLTVDPVRGRATLAR